MLKRGFWLVLGFGLGVGVTFRVNRAVRRGIKRYLPPGATERLLALNAALDERVALIRARRQVKTARS